MAKLNVVLISTYELGHQPFGLASPAAWLKAAGANVTCLDLAVQKLEAAPVVAADVIAIYVAMHTATRIATPVVRRIRQLNPRAHLCFYGLYAPLNASFLRKLGADTILGGEFEEGLVALINRLSAQPEQPQAQPEARISLAKQQFLTPDRSGLPALQQYAYLDMGAEQRRTAGYTEASRGCKHMCRHCPIPPVYAGQFRIVQRDVVLDDVARQVTAGAQHITFGDPDFFNGPGHALAIVQALHQRFPDLTYDVTIKIEHLLKYARHLPTLRDTGCVFVTSAVESVDNAILELFDKRHTCEDFIRVVALFREVGLHLNPTFVALTPWTSLSGYLDLLALIADLDLVEHVSPIQYTIRLLIPAGSKLLELPDVQQLIEPFDAAALCYPWSHTDRAVDQFYAEVRMLVKACLANHEARPAIFSKVWDLAYAAYRAAGGRPRTITPATAAPLRAPIPYLSEPWYC